MIKSLFLMLTACTSLMAVFMSFAGVNPVTVSYLSGITTFSTGSNGTANYVVAVNSNVMPPNTPLTFRLSSTGSSSAAFTASQIISGASPCSGISTLCNGTFSLSAGQRCCLAFTLTSPSVGSYSLQPTINTTPPAYPAQASMDNNLVFSVIPPAIETAVGVNNDQTTPFPLLAQTVDGGMSWAVLNINNAPGGGQFFNTLCKGSGDRAYCLAVGGTPDNEPLFTVAPFIAQKKLNESSWALTHIENAPALGNFYGASCNSDAHICMGG